MDRKSIVILVVTILLFLVWAPLVNRIFPPIPIPQQTNAPTMGTNIPQAELTAISTNVVAGTNIVATASTNAPAGKEENLIIETESARYHFSSLGGGIKLIELKNFKSFVGC